MTTRTQPRSDDARRARDRPIISWRLVTSAFLVGVATGAAVGLAVGAPVLAVLVGWSVASAGLLVWVWRVVWPQDYTGTKRLAEEEGRTRATDTAVLVAAVTSLAAVVTGLVQSSRQGAVAVAEVVLGLVVVVLSWAVLNTVFALKYARLYYDGGDGGIDFKQQEHPAYSDFAYMGFTVGMAFSAPETEPASTGIRKVALGHALLSYLFGTVLFAVAVNLVTNLGSS
jgi:uncharacterized membrane protein